MINLMTASTLTDRPVVAASPLGVSLPGSGLLACSASLLVLPVLPVRERSERPTMAPAVAAKSQARVAYSFAAANGAGVAAGAGIVKGAFAGNGAITAVARIEQQQKKTQHGMWAFRGPEPWSDPA